MCFVVSLVTKFCYSLYSYIDVVFYVGRQTSNQISEVMFNGLSSYQLVCSGWTDSDEQRNELTVELFGLRTIRIHFVNHNKKKHDERRYQYFYIVER